MTNWKKVTKEEFEQYLKNYPRELETDVNGICEPPLVTYNDFTLGKYPQSIVAKYYNNKMGYEPDRPIEYYIRGMENGKNN